VWFRFEECLNIDRDFGSIQIFCTIRLADHRAKPGTDIQCKTKDSSCHRQSSVITLHEEGIYYLYNFVPNNFKECDLDLKNA
jgi:hypothetical protein